ncbi:phosphate-starvation-inducible PsiE family protein [Leptothermofonsia sichuanensis E412]|uniref:phosphate-starvation-inducible PsiE family protein n=1 Tax=Leptothermofonsia sichuanensis TaxID=2917832 RepID=UPI001CA77DC2|nr:phosphate-starvation-inducible PsiE family protein [Leptothermofonsia sichuanensis]QZZ22914.1 phosphate-starvation-inducible PsiE family protein [Leptothermofonsia sichuanensis E412]
MNAKDNRERLTPLENCHDTKSSSVSDRCWASWFHRETVVRNLEIFQNFIVVSLCIGIFCVMLIRLGEMFLSLVETINFQAITSDILFILILVEIFRLLIIYLQEQRISIGAAVEVSLVSALREVILQGVLDIPINQLLGVCVFLIVLGGLLALRVWMFQRFDVIKQSRSEESSDYQNSKLRRFTVVDQYPF